MKREPLFNIPPVIVGLLAVLALVHAVRTYVLTDQQDMEFLLTFAFIPSRYDTSIVLGGVLPGGFGAELWTFVTYALIHADWTHYGVNAVWLLPFGSAVARRFGAAAVSLVFRRDGGGRRGAASRHACRRGSAGDRRIGGNFRHHGGGDAVCVSARRAAQFPPQRRRHRLSRAGDPAQRRAARSARLAFVAVWFGINILFGLGSLPLPGAGANQVVAWQAHIGGFLAGLIFFSWFDPAPQEPHPDDIAMPQ